jgi:hypothetical protein
MSAKRLPFPAWPEIQNRHHSLCLPTLFRAMYIDKHIVLGNTSEEEEEAIEKSYFAQFPDVMTPDIIEHYYDLADLFPKRNEHADIMAEKLLYLSITKDGSHIAGATALQGFFAGMNGNFYGSEDAFGFAHEFAHFIPQWLYSGIILTSRSMRAHELINSIMMKTESQREDIPQLWAEFTLVNTRLEVLVQKFEPIEEIFANYLGLQLSPPDIRNSVEKELEQKLKERNLYDSYTAFADACEIGQANGVSEAPCKVYNVWCAIYDRTILTLQESAIKAAYISKCAFRGEEQELLNILDKSLSVMYELGIKMWEVVGGRLLLAAMRNFSHVEDRAIFPPFIFLLGVKDKIIPLFSSMFTSEKLANDISHEIFLESIRQQLRWEYGLHCPYAPINLKDDDRQAVLGTLKERGGYCPHFSNKGCCGRNEALWNLYRRLPEEKQKSFSPPTCPVTT